VSDDAPPPEPPPEYDDALPPEPSPEHDAPSPDLVPASGPEADHEVDITELVNAPDHADHLIERLTEAFPGAELQAPAEDDAP
jgi:hypothetical protein